MLPQADPATRDRFLGCLLGGAIGDALGYPIEFVRSAAEIAARFGTAPPAELAYHGPAVVSDDTQMTLFSAEALLRARAAGAGEGGVALFALGAYQRWYATQATLPPPSHLPVGQGILIAEPRLYVRRAPGQTCIGAIVGSFVRQAVGTVDDPPNFSKGCGAVMRAAPFGLAARTRAEAFVTARDAAALTHGHPSGYLSAAYLGALVYDLARGLDLAEAMRAADVLLSREREHAELAAAIAAARQLAARGIPAARDLEQLGGGWVGEEALAIALACALTAGADDVGGALWRSAAHGGDSDSTGSITGNLVGAMFGARALPARWREQVELADLVERIAIDLHDVAIAGAAPDPVAYPATDGTVRLRREQGETGGP
jgi:ADP-ribosylglycohydrolase